MTVKSKVDKKTSNGSYTEKDVAYENDTHWVLDKGRVGFEVYKTGLTHSTRVASIGRSLGLPRAVEEADKRHAKLVQAQ